MFSFIKNFLIKEKDNPWLFFIVTFFLTWLFWLPAALINQSYTSTTVIVLIILGGIAGKIVPPTLLPYLTYGKKGWNDYWQRIIDFKRVSIKWWLITIGLPVLFVILGVITGFFLGYPLPTFELTNPIKIIPFAVFILLYGPLPEEMGWVGYELDRLQAKFNALNASLILGFFWLLWHLPLFFIEGSYQHDEVVLGSMRFWLTFVLGIICLQILQTWIYNNTHRSTLTAVMIHFMVNFNGELLNLSDIHEYLRAGWTLIFTVAVIGIFGYQTLTGENKAPNFNKILDMGIETDYS